MPWTHTQLARVIVDRGSVFTATLIPAETVADAALGLERLVAEKKFRTATHNVVAYRLRDADGRIVEHKDDGYSGRNRESGAGRVVLDVMRAREVVGAVVVVTRWFGGVKLGGDRFRHFASAASQVIDAALTTDC
jgi:putative IMPACT (imprinted ancient) family translation regulator